MRFTGIMRRLKLLAFPLILLLALPAAAETVEAQLKRMTNELLAAVAPGDTSVWKKFTDDGFVYVTEANEVLTKGELLEQLKPLPKGLVGRLQVGDDFRVVQHGDVAIATMVADERLDYHGQILDSQFRMTDTWRRTSDGWRLLSSMVLAVLADPPAIALPRDTLCGYEGSYRLTDTIETTIRCTDDGLQSERTGRKPVVQKPEVLDVFFEPGQPRTRRIFQRNERGEITGFVDRREARDIRWTKVAPKATQRATPVACGGPEHRQFDFWLGDWDVYDVASEAATGVVDERTPDAHVRIERALGDCVIRELYEDPTGLRGESLSIYDAGRALWSHTWVTNRGQLITLEGRKRDEELFLEGHAITKGVDTLYRAVWKREGDGVRHQAETSVDGGKSWKEWFDLRFRRRKP